MKLSTIMFTSLIAAMSCAADFQLTANAPVHKLSDDPRNDLRAGMNVRAKVRFDADPEKDGEMTIVQKGNSNEIGAYLLRVDGGKENVKFSFFVNTDGRPEPRVSVPVKPKAGEWHDVAAGWDGTNAWISVNGKTARIVRKGTNLFPLDSQLCIGPMRGLVRDFAIDVPSHPVPEDTALRPGFCVACDVTFTKQPKGENYLLDKFNEYLLRYDEKSGGGGAFTFFVNIDGSWEPRASVPVQIELGRTYRLCGRWSGTEISLAVDGVACEPVKRAGRRRTSPAKLKHGVNDCATVANIDIRNENKPMMRFGQFRTRELMPFVGEPATLAVPLDNIGCDVGACTLTATGGTGVAVTPAQIEIPSIAEGEKLQFEWKIDAGTNSFAYIDFAVTPRGAKKPVHKASKRVVFMPKEEPKLTANEWNPEIRATRTFYVDADNGLDGNDGLSPRTAWRTFRHVKEMTLGPGERLLLKRGCVFNEELIVKAAAGREDNWAEIGAYGAGGRPQIRRTRHINDRCVFVKDAKYLVVRDLIVCNAGAGLSVACVNGDSGHILIERCLAHHIEGTYRFNSHGIPEWWNEPGPSGARSYGIAVAGGSAKNVVMRDCETYQCSSGFRMYGTDTFMNRIYCHDNYAHNTSPHPYNTASRSWVTDCVFEASGWHASAGTMGMMLWGNDGWVMRGCHVIGMPDSGSGDQGGIDFEAQGENCLIDKCTFRNNAGAAIEVLGLIKPQTRNVHIRGCKFDRNNWSYKNGPAEIQVWGSQKSSPEIVCSNGRIENNGYVLVPGVDFYTNDTQCAKDWVLENNRRFDFSRDLDAAFPYGDPPEVKACGEVWTDDPEVALSANVNDPKARVRWEVIEGRSGVKFANADSVCTKASFPGAGDWRVNVTADNGKLWRASHTAVHVLPKGWRTFGVWDFSKNLDTQGWVAENTGTKYEYIHGTSSFWDTESFPVKLVCGDYYVIAVKASGTAALTSPDSRDLGVSFLPTRSNAVRIKMQNGTTSEKMRLWWQTDANPEWDEKNSVVFATEPCAEEDAVYTIRMPDKIGTLKQVRLSFSADGKPVTGTVRIDYIWMGRAAGDL